MPLHPVPIIIGTTLAVIGSGYAFKKFIYDPHLAPFVDAFIAQHLPHSHQAPVPDPIPIPAVSSGHSASTNTNRHPHTHSHLRRRSHARRESIHELEESLLHHSKKTSHGHGHGNGQMLEEHHEPVGSSRNSVIDDSHPLIQIEENHPRSETPQEAEIREIIFNYAPTPSRSGTRTPASLAESTSTSTGDDGQSRNPFLSPLDPKPHTSTGGAGDGGVPSTTFSFLSLSQQSSPEDMHQTLDSLSSLSFAGAADQLHSHPPRTRRDVDDDNEDEVVSLPETENERMSEYQDAESYSPVSRARTPAEGAQSTQIQQTLLPGENRQVIGMVSDPLSDLGLSYVHQPLAQRSAPASASASARSGGRGPMSVVSISEDEEGWRSESDWEAVGSDAGR